jgi:Zn-dependent peptidase ImmA (M78 family)
MEKNKEMNTIAHEIAHFILGHYRVEVGSEAERKADDLCEKWGFRRCY